MKIYLMGTRVSSAKLQKSFRTNVYCPTLKHVTTQLFRNFHYQEFCYMGRRTQMKLKTGVSLKRLWTNLFVMPYQAITKLSWTYSITPWKRRFMDFQLVKADRLITTFQIRWPKGLIKLVLAIKKQHQLVMVMSRQVVQGSSKQA